MDWIERVEHIRRWAQNGKRAPHKPLLLLYALGRFQADGGTPIRFLDAEQPLSLLLGEFGPPNPTNPGYPFHHLVSDGLWHVSTRDGTTSPGSTLRALRESDATGQLDSALVKALNDDSHLLTQLARTILDANFEPSLHPDLCAATGLDLEAAELSTVHEPAAKRRHRRSADFRREVLTAYEFQCAFCGFDGMLTGSAVALDAAHIRWWAFDGPDTIANGICLCVLHHKLFHKGVLGLSKERTVTVSTHFISRSAAARDHVLNLLDAPARPPQARYPAAESLHVDWHRSEVFRGPTRVASHCS
jgi:putative restriction endonuclease